MYEKVQVSQILLAAMMSCWILFIGVILRFQRAARLLDSMAEDNPQAERCVVRRGVAAAVTGLISVVLTLITLPRSGEHDVLSEVQLPETAVRIVRTPVYVHSKWYPFEQPFRGCKFGTFESTAGMLQLDYGQKSKPPVVRFGKPVVQIGEFSVEEGSLLRVKTFQILTGFHRDEEGKVVLEWSEIYGGK